MTVALLWHMHQPRYVHPGTGRPVLPWVRLHACSGYYDMARALERRPGARVTVNFVPSLVEQIEALVAGARDPLEEAAEKAPGDLTEAERRLVVARSFSVRRDRAVATRPRYAELLALRGTDERPQAVAEAAARFGPTELRDLQCLFLLAWLGFAARQDDPAIDALDAKGRLFSDADLAALRAAARRAAGEVLPAWRRLAGRGQVELAASPYYHPIIPLVIDSDAARRSRPADPLPPRFAWPGDATEQIRLAQESHAHVFGARPAGMWPPEGSLSPEAVAAYAACGVSWLAGDEEVLARSLAGHPHAGAARKIWRHGGVNLMFRDRDLSDRIGFRYADLPATDAAADLMSATRGGGGVVGLFLDGENAWESYPRRGADFLDALYAGLEKDGRASTISEAIAEHGPGEPLERLHSGSWIDGTFRVWIGDPVKNRAWAQLSAARQRLAVAEKSAAAGAGAAGCAAAWRLLLAAEGSDWFWWFGEPFSSAEDPVFDELFRAHLAAAWRALGEDPPAALSEPLYAPEAAAHRGAITALIRPRVDGKGDRFYEWHGAARFDVGRGGAMAEASTAVLRCHLGFDESHLYIRLDPARGHQRRVHGASLVLHVRAGAIDTALRVQVGASDGGPGLRALGGRIGAQDIVEIALPLVRLGARPREELNVSMSLEFGGLLFARIPRDGVYAVTVPWEGWEDENWTA